MRAQLRVRDQNINAAISEDVADFIRFEKVVDRDDDGGGVEDAEQRGNKFRTILEPESNAITGFDVELVREFCGDCERLRLERRESEFFFIPEDSGLLRMLRDRLIKGFGQIHSADVAG